MPAGDCSACGALVYAETVYENEDEKYASLIPVAILAGLQRYRDEHTPVGHFLTSVLENDLHRAVAHADQSSLKALKTIVQYVYNELPGSCWGDKKAVKEWLSVRGNKENTVH